MDVLLPPRVFSPHVLLPGHDSFCRHPRIPGQHEGPVGSSQAAHSLLPGDHLGTVLHVSLCLFLMTPFGFEDIHDVYHGPDVGSFPTT